MLKHSALTISSITSTSILTATIFTLLATPALFCMSAPCLGTMISEESSFSSFYEANGIGEDDSDEKNRAEEEARAAFDAELEDDLGQLDDECRDVFLRALGMGLDGLPFIKKLLDAGLDVDTQVTTLDVYEGQPLTTKKTLLIEALYNNHLDVAQLLIDRKADTNACALTAEGKEICPLTALLSRADSNPAFYGAAALLFTNQTMMKHTPQLACLLAQAKEKSPDFAQALAKRPHSLNQAQRAAAQKQRKGFKKPEERYKKRRDKQRQQRLKIMGTLDEIC